MGLSADLSGVMSQFRDKRVVRNMSKLAQNMIEHKSICLWTISEDKAEFERRKRVIDGSLVSVLGDEKSQERYGSIVCQPWGIKHV
jgi:hypothetical protein